MKLRCKVSALTAILFLLAVLLPWTVAAEEPKAMVPDKELCAKMLRFGKEAYMRGKYLDAKEYFRKAVQADPTSETAWQHYDLAAIFALAEKVEKNADLVAPDVSARELPAPGTAAPPPPAPTKPGTGKKGGVKMKDEEGC